MGRPIKKGIDYFPLQVTFDERIELLEQTYGLKGTSILIHLWQKIYGEKGYYMHCEREMVLLFGRKLGVHPDDNIVFDIINFCIKKGLFDKKLYEQYNILTSEGIQERYLEAVRKRKVRCIKPEFMLINYNHSEFLPEETELMAEESTQIRQDNTILNDTILNETKSNDTILDENLLLYIRSHFLNKNPVSENEYKSFVYLFSSYEKKGVESDLILAVLKYSVGLGKYDLRYAFKVLKYTCESGITTAKEFEVQNAANEKRQQHLKVKPGPLNNFTQPLPDYDLIIEEIKKKQSEYGNIKPEQGTS